MSIVLIALALLSIAAAWLTAGRMKAEDIRLTESRLYTVTADMETQVATMRQTALEIASMQEFLPDYFEQDKYREVELLSLLERYGSRVAISDYYFIKYQGNQTIFTSQGTTMPLTLYFTERLPEAEDVYKRQVYMYGQECGRQQDGERSFIWRPFQEFRRS